LNTSVICHQVLGEKSHRSNQAPAAPGHPNMKELRISDKYD
jgi:hypothetical protein